METNRKLIRKQSLEKLYNKLTAERRVFAPVISSGRQAEYRYNPDFAEITFEHIRSALSVKNVVFPKVENLLFFSNSKTESTIEETDTDRIPETVLWGTHPCDNAAFDTLRSIFCWDIEDKFFTKRMEKLSVIGLSCHMSDEFCFCTSTGLRPDSSKGSDILLSKLQNGDYQADIFTEKGKEILSAAPELFEPLTDDKVLLSDVSIKFKHDKVTSALAHAFEHPFWIENSLRCIGCGACAYVCPTCACFDIQDETKGKYGRRYRSWDSCGFGLFTLHTSGHNPRSVQSQRWRQRIMHKFSYMPERNETLG
jgi:ferredoxin